MDKIKQQTKEKIRLEYLDTGLGLFGTSNGFRFTCKLEYKDITVIVHEDHIDAYTSRVFNFEIVDDVIDECYKELFKLIKKD